MGLMANPEILTIRGLKSTPYHSIAKPRPLAGFGPEQMSAVGNIFTAFGNHEAKALTLLTLGEIEDDVTKYQLRSELTRLTGNVWNLHDDSVENYLKTLKKFGGFTDVEHSPIGRERWQLTATGVNALPAAAYILIESYRYSIPLILAFGSSVSPNNQHAPTNTLLVLTDMTTKDKAVSVSRLVKDIGVKYNAVDLNILRLVKLGLIDYDSLTPEKGEGTIKYSVAKDIGEQDLPKLQGKAGYMVRAFYRIMKRANTPFSVDDVVATVETDQSLDPRLRRLKSLRLVANNVLGALRSAGLLKSNLTAVTDQSRVSFKVDNNLKDFIAEIVPGILGYLEGNPQMVQKLDLARSFLMSQSEEAQLIREFLMNRARANSFWSPEALKSQSDRVTEIYRFLLDNPNSRVATITQAINSSVPEAKNALYRLMSNQKVVRIRIGRGSYFSASMVGKVPSNNSFSMAPPPTETKAFC